MKFKTILACAVLGLVIFNGRLNAAVESDVVGYQTVDLDNLGYALVSLPFADIDSVADGYPLQKITGELSQNNNKIRADSIMVMDPNTKAYTSYQLKPTIGWVKEGESVATTDVIPLGAAVFVKKAMRAGQFTMSGRVLTDETISVDLTVGLNLVSNPYPADINIADIKGTLSANNNAIRADKIMTLNPVTKVYTNYQLKTIGWVKDGESVVTTDKIKSGEGFFYKKAMRAGSLTFARPF